MNLDAANQGNTMLSSIGYPKSEKSPLVYNNRYKYNDRFTSISENINTSWRYMKTEHKMAFYVEAIEQFGSPYVFTLKFTYMLHDQLVNAKQCGLDFIMARFRKFLKGVPVLLTLEQDQKEKGTERFHVHGILAAGDRPIEEIREQLKAITGRIEKDASNGVVHFKNNVAVDIKPPDPLLHKGGKYGIDGWAVYITKDINKTSHNLRHMSFTRNLTREAKRIHSEVRDSFYG